MKLTVSTLRYGKQLSTGDSSLPNTPAETMLAHDPSEAEKCKSRRRWTRFGLIGLPGDRCDHLRDTPYGTL